MSLGVVWAFVMRYLYLYTRNWVRLVELVFWPTMELVLWGSLTIFLREKGDTAFPVAWLIGGVIFWDVLFRAQQAVAISFLEDVWTRNLLNVFAAPVRTLEYVCAGMMVGVIRTAVTVFVLSLLAALSYHFQILDMKLSLIPFFGNLLIFGWALGMISSALILRWGQAAENLAWAVPFLIQPAAAVFYPLHVLPGWAQVIGNCLPCTHIFEGMRAVLAGQDIPWSLVGNALALNAVWMLLAGSLYVWVIENGRRNGLLTRVTSH